MGTFDFHPIGERYRKSGLSLGIGSAGPLVGLDPVDSDAASRELVSEFK